MNRKLALVIGNSNYSDPEFSILSASAKDVAGLAKVLRDPNIGAFDAVTELSDENTSSILRSIAIFFAKKSHNDILLLYFPGHGVLDDHGHFYLASEDAAQVKLPGSCGYYDRKQPKLYRRRTPLNFIRSRRTQNNERAQ